MLDQKNHSDNPASASKQRTQNASGPSRPAIRKVLHEALLTDSAISAFCLDYFPTVHRCFSCAMDRTGKVNILLEMTSVSAVWDSLQSHLRDEPQRLETLSQMLKYVDSPSTLQSQRAIDAMERLYLERARLQLNQQSVFEIDTHILALKRSLRQGPQLNEGEVLSDRYRLLEVIGKGGFAKVWQAFDRKARQLVAVKVLHSDQVEERNRRERFLRGARQMRSLEHSHIVRMLDGPDEYMGFCYFVMEHLAGGDLARATLRGQIDTNQGLLAILQIGAALECAHRRGIIHRDVKPQNILLDGNGLAKLGDFDLVWAPDTTGGTRTGAMGTFLYAAPEELDDASRIDARADVYSLAMTALFVLHKHPLPRVAVFSRAKFIEQMACPSTLKSVLQQATSVDPEERPATVKKFCDALRDSIVTHTAFSAVPNLPIRIQVNQPQIIAEAPGAEPPTAVTVAYPVALVPTADPPRRAHHKRKPAAIAGLLLLLAGLVLTAHRCLPLSKTGSPVVDKDALDLTFPWTPLDLSASAGVMLPQTDAGSPETADPKNAAKAVNFVDARNTVLFPPFRLADRQPQAASVSTAAKEVPPGPAPAPASAPVDELADMGTAQQSDDASVAEKNPYPFDLSTVRSVSPKIQRAESCYGKKDYDCIVRELKVALQIVNEPVLLLNIAHAHFEAGRPLEARESYEEYRRAKSNLWRDQHEPTGLDLGL